MIGVDASTAAKWVLSDEEHADKARALYLATIRDHQVIIAPPLILSEVTNVLRQRVRRRSLTIGEADHALADFLALPLLLTLPPWLYRRALEIAHSFSLPASYDAQYVALAEALGYDLWTNDRALLRALGSDVNYVRWIGNYEDDSPRNERDDAHRDERR